MKDTDLAWLGGIWDGEGSIIMFSHTEKNGSKKICPTVSMVNTDLAIINKARKILEEIGCNFLFQERSKYKTKKHYKDQYALITRNQMHIVKFLEAVTPYIFSYKKEAAEIVRDYCRQRIDKMDRLPSKGSTPYDETDWSYLNAYQDRFRSSQTTREDHSQEQV